jgi:hypothetical protein
MLRSNGRLTPSTCLRIVKGSVSFVSELEHAIAQASGVEPNGGDS